MKYSNPNSYELMHTNVIKAFFELYFILAYSNQIVEMLIVYLLLILLGGKHLGTLFPK